MVSNYTLLIYNSPTVYDHDYYVFIPHEYDPIAKLIYGFSVWQHYCYSF